MLQSSSFPTDILQIHDEILDMAVPADDLLLKVRLGTLESINFLRQMANLKILRAQLLGSRKQLFVSGSLKCPQSFKIVLGSLQLAHFKTQLVNQSLEVCVLLFGALCISNHPLQELFSLEDLLLQQ